MTIKKAVSMLYKSLNAPVVVNAKLGNDKYYSFVMEVARPNSVAASDVAMVS